MNFKVKCDLVHDGVAFSEGDILDGALFTKKQKKRLLSIKAISECHESPNVEIYGDEEADGEELEVPSGLPEVDENFEEVELTDDDVKKELDAGFTHTELVKEMEVLEMNFKKNDSKEKLIELILDEEKDEHFLDLLEGR